MISIFWSSSRSLIIHELAVIMLKVSIIFLFLFFLKTRKIAVMFDVKTPKRSNLCFFFFPSFETAIHKHHGPRCSLRRATNDSN